MSTMHVEVASKPKRRSIPGEAEFLVAPGEMGELGVYPRHVPLLTSHQARPASSARTGSG